ncbi:hypothetical protein IWQ61_002768 [Dispira simplex]|nr:hypothetical protein IWQ61_002768 [Dispira simplex]
MGTHLNQHPYQAAAHLYGRPNPRTQRAHMQASGNGTSTLNKDTSPCTARTVRLRHQHRRLRSFSTKMRIHTVSMAPVSTLHSTTQVMSTQLPKQSAISTVHNTTQNGISSQDTLVAAPFTVANAATKSSELVKDSRGPRETHPVQHTETTVTCPLVSRQHPHAAPGPRHALPVMHTSFHSYQDEDDYLFSRLPVENSKQIQSENANKSFLQLALEAPTYLTHEKPADELDGFQTPRNSIMSCIMGVRTNDSESLKPSPMPVPPPGPTRTNSCPSIFGESLYEQIVRFNEFSHVNTVHRLFGYDPNVEPDIFGQSSSADLIRDLF